MHLILQIIMFRQTVNNRNINCDKLKRDIIKATKIIRNKHMQLKLNHSDEDYLISKNV